MKARHLLLSLTIALAFISCGTQKQAVTTSDKGPLVQTKFYGVEFGDSRTRVYNHMHRYQLTKSNDGSYTIFNRDFGGYNWHFIEMGFVDRRFYYINFQQEYKQESSAKERFDSIYRMLKIKYGEMDVTDSGDGFVFTDSEKNSVTVRCHLGTSKGGDEYWYCDLIYNWGAGTLISVMKSLEEI